MPRPLSHPCRFTAINITILLAICAMAPASAQDPARVDQMTAPGPAVSAAMRPMAASSASPHPSPVLHAAVLQSPASLPRRWNALTQVSPEQYRQAYGDAQILQRFGSPTHAAVPASDPIAGKMAADANRLRLPSDDLLRSLQPALQQLKHDVNTELQRRPK